MDGINVVGVQFRRAGKIYDFLADNHLLHVGESVVVDTERGPAVAEVVKLKFTERSYYGEGGLKPIVRKASAKDLDPAGKLNEEEARKYAERKVKELQLDMRVLKSEIQFGGNKVIVYFTAPARVDFRELVKQLAGGLKARVELKQVGARDETKIMGGVGICGREFCCSSFLREFVPVSIKMAKNQNLALNPTKVSGGCGRLLCCLTYENDIYTELRLKLPPIGSRVKLIRDDNFGDVVRTDLLNQMCIVEDRDGQQVRVPVSQVEVVERKGGKNNSDQDSDWGEDIDLKSLMDDEKSTVE
jgi:cell fate regulator YaaT (PSP1 superfamily)